MGIVRGLEPVTNVNVSHENRVRVDRIRVIKRPASKLQPELRIQRDSINAPAGAASPAAGAGAVMDVGAAAAAEPEDLPDAFLETLSINCAPPFSNHSWNSSYVMSPTEAQGRDKR